MKERNNVLGKLAYACGDIYGGSSFVIVGLLLLAYLTQVEGISGVWAGVIIFVGKAWDAVTDPFMGILSDRTKSRHGRRRFFFLIGAAPVFISWVMLWYSFGITDMSAKIAYYMFAFMLFSTAFTVVMVPYNAILADMTSDYDKRSAFTGMRLSFSAGGAILAGVVPSLITQVYAVRQTGYLVMAVAFGLVFALSWLAVFFGTWESAKAKERAGFGYKEWFSVLKNRSFRLYALTFIFSQMAIDITMATAVFYLSVSLQKSHLFTLLMGSILVVQLLFIIVFSRVAQRFGKKLPGIVAAVVWIAANIAIFTFSPQTPDMLIVAVCALIGVGAAGCNMVSWSILPDIFDVDELMTGQRREGLYAGVSTFLRKLSGGVVVGLSGVLLELFRYDGAAVGAGVIDPVTDTGVKLLFCLLPVVFLGLMLFFLRKYRLGKTEFDVMHGVLAACRQQGRAVSINEEQAAVCESVTGVKNLFDVS